MEKQPYLDVKIEGINIAGSITFAAIEDNDLLIDKATIIAEDSSGFLADIPREGQKIVIDMGYDDEHAVLFEGLLTDITIEAHSDGNRKVSIIALDNSFLLMQKGPKCCDYDGTLSSILEKIVGAEGITVGQIRLETDPSWTPESPLRQTNIRDWQFIQDLAWMFGALAFVEYNEGKSKFYFVSRSFLLQSEPIGQLSYAGTVTGNLISFKYQRIAHSASTVQTSVTVNPLTGEVIAAPTPPVTTDDPALIPAPYKTASDEYIQAFDLASQAIGKPKDQRPDIIAAGVPSTADLSLVCSPPDPTRKFGLYGEGTTIGNIRMRSKSTISMTGVSTWVEGIWYLQQVTHIITCKIYTTKFVVTR